MHLTARPVRAALIAAVLSLAGVCAIVSAPVVAPARADLASPVVTVGVTGSGVTLRPAFDPAIQRYAVATDAGTNGTVTVDATTSDPAGTVQVDGSPVSGPVTLHGLVAGDEISVLVDDAAGHHAYSLVYLPVGFPAITKVVDTGAAQPGQVLLTLGHFAVAVDRNGVPTVLRDFGASVADLKPGPNGHYTVMALQPGSATNWELYELDNTFATIAPSPYRAVGLANTDSHDSVLDPDGTRYFVGYQPDAATGLTDPTIQEVGPDGQVIYTWDGADHLDPAAETTNATASGPAADWAHINAIQVLPDGDILASFRHLSAVMRIAWSAHDGFQRGDVEWRFGGRLDDFAFPNDPYGGPCAQHAARLLANGDLMIYDNGSAALGANPSYCVDPTDRSGPTVNRPFTRVTEYSLDTTTMTATLVRSWTHADAGVDRFSYFAGSAFRLGGGDDLVDWAAYSGALVSEVDPAGAIVWELSAPSTWSYRAQKAEVPDTTRPAVSVALPGSGRYDIGDPATPAVTCTDAGGSGLQSCTWSGAGLVTTAAGHRTFAVTAVDGSGNTTLERRSYVVAATQPQVQVWTPGGWSGSRTVHLRRRDGSRTCALRLVNRSVVARRLALAPGVPPSGYRAHYLYAGRDITRAVAAGTWRSPAIGAGGSLRLQVVVRRGASAVPGGRLRIDGMLPAAGGTPIPAVLVLRSR